MGKFIRISASIPLLGLFFIAFLIQGSFSGCQEAPRPAEKAYLDTLKYRIAGDTKALNIDTEELAARKQEIREKWFSHIKDTFPDIRKKMNDDFRGMISAYDLFLNNHLLLIAATRLLESEADEFREDTENGRYSRQAFKEKYKDLNRRAIQNSEAVEAIARPVYELEPMWIRLKMQFDKKEDNRQPQEIK
jgi:hypothetical protein